MKLLIHRHESGSFYPQCKSDSYKSAQLTVNFSLYIPLDTRTLKYYKDSQTKLSISLIQHFK